MDDALNCSDILPLLMMDFSSLWKCKQRGNTLEIVTPFSTVSQGFISVFITKRGNDYIVSDGGWLSKNAYQPQDTEERREGDDKSLEFYKESFGVAVHNDKAQIPLYYKKCTEPSLVSSVVYDVSNFICGTVGTRAFIAGSEHDVSRLRFQKKATDFLTSRIFEPSKLLPRHPIDDVKGLIFPVVVINGLNLSLVTYVSGSTRSYFASDVRKAIINFELSERSRKYYSLVRDKISLVDDEATGYTEVKDDLIMTLLGEKTTKPPILWSQKEEIIPLLQKTGS